MQDNPLGIGIMGACFQAPCCRTQTMTDGNALCSLISFVFQHSHFDKILQGKRIGSMNY